MRIQDKLIFRGVVKDGHLLGANDHQSLLFDWMQPADENVSLDPAWEFEMAQCNVWDSAIQVRTTLAGNTSGHFIEERQHHRDIVRSKTPKYILLRPYFPHVQTIGIQIVDFSKSAVLYQLLEFQDCRMLSENVSNHQNLVLGLSQFHELLAVLNLNSEWLFVWTVLSDFYILFAQFLWCHCL